MWMFSIIAVFLPLLGTGVAVPAPNPEPLSLATADKFTDFPVNVILTAGAAQFGAWIPANGILYATTTLTCLNAGASAYGACSIPSFDRIGVVAGNGPCTVFGTNGFQKTLTGNPGEGFQTVAPPQQLSFITCGAK